MIKEIKTSRIKAELNKHISSLELNDVGNLVWVKLGHVDIGAYFKDLDEIVFNITDFIIASKIYYSKEIHNLLKVLLYNKLHDLFKDENPINITFK